MRVSPITNTTPQPKTSPAFQARVPKNIVKQLMNKTEALQSINILSKTGIMFSVPAAAAAKLYADSSDKQIDDSVLASLSRVEYLPSSEELEKLSDEDLINMAQVQDTYGNTIFHFDNNPETLERFLDKAPHKTAAEVFMLADKDGYTAYISNDDSRMTELMKDGIQKIATSGELSIETAIQLLFENRFNDNLIEFLKMRTQKIGGTTSSSVNPALYKQITERNDEKLDVQTPNATYKDLPIREAALFFNTNGAEPELASLDRKYLQEMANSDEMEELLDSAFLDPESKCIQDIMLSASYDTIKHRIDPSRIKIEDIEMIIKSAPSEKIAEKWVKDLYTKQDDKAMGILQYSASRADSDFGEHLKLLGLWLEKKDIDWLMLNNDSINTPPMEFMHGDGKAAEATIDWYKQDPKMLSKIFKQTDILNMTRNTNVVEGLVEQLKDEPEELAKILGMQEELLKEKSPYTELLESKIIDLATDSDLSLSQSIDLLESNNLAPQLQEFLKMQFDTKND